jgi:hypothetical protein
MKSPYIYIFFLIILSFNSCNLFETKIEFNRDSFFSIYPKGSNNYSAINGDYVTKTSEGFLLGGSFSPVPDNITNQIRVSHIGNLINENILSNAFVSYKKILPTSNEQDFYMLGLNAMNSAMVLKMALADSLPSLSYSYSSSITPIDFCVSSDNNLTVLTQNNENFPAVLMLTHFDENLNILWEREFTFDEVTPRGLNVVYEKTNNHFIVLAKVSLNQKLFLMDINEDGNLVNTRFFEEFNIGNITIPQTSPDSSNPSATRSYEPVLLDMETHYMVVETGRYYERNDNLPYSSIYRIEKDLSNIIALEGINTNFSSVNTVQNLDNEIVINGFIDDVFAIKKLDSDGKLIDWDTGESFVTFDMNLELLSEGEVFSSSPTLGNFDDFFIPGNIVKTTDGGYAMIGTYGLFNGEDFETVMTLFKFKSDGSY